MKEYKFENKKHKIKWLWLFTSQLRITCLDLGVKCSNFVTPQKYLFFIWLCIFPGSRNLLHIQSKFEILRIQVMKFSNKSNLLIFKKLQFILSAIKVVWRKSCLKCLCNFYQCAFFMPSEAKCMIIWPSAKIGNCVLLVQLRKLYIESFNYSLIFMTIIFCKELSCLCIDSEIRFNKKTLRF